MFCTITARGPNADDLGFVLAKHPQRVHRRDLGWGEATVFFPRADEEVCQAALLVEVDALWLARSARFKASGFELGDHINDRPYAASSLLAVAVGRVFHSGLIGSCKERPELVDRAVPLTVHVPALPTSDGAGFVRGLFEPLGWDVDAAPVPLAADDASWGDSRYVALTLTGTQTVQAALQQLYVLLPVLDNAKHYWVGETETDKLLRYAGEWLAGHPLRETVMARYLAHQRRYVADATARLLAGHDVPADDGTDAAGSCQPPSLGVERRAAIVAELVRHEAWRVADVGCGEGLLLRELLADARFTQIVGTDVSPSTLARAERTLDLDRLPDRARERVALLQSSLTYTDARLAGFDAIMLAEVIEHVDPERHDALASTVFGAAAPRVVVLTTPNAEYNEVYGMAPGTLRHADHRFEWTRTQFAAWAEQVAARYGYRVEGRPVGPEDAHAGAPTQCATFTKREAGHGR